MLNRILIPYKVPADKMEMLNSNIGCESGNNLEENLDYWVVGNRSCIMAHLREWLEYKLMGKDKSIQLVSDVCHYNMVLFIDLFGGAFSLLNEISPTCHDINQDIARYYSISDAEAFNITRENKDAIGDLLSLDNANKHNALWDARVIRAWYNKIHGEANDG